MKRIAPGRGLALLIVLLVAADWLSKFWIVNRLALGESWPLVENWLYFVHRQNPGVAFSLLADLPDAWRVPLLSALTIVGLVLFTRILLVSHDPVTRAASAVVVAGALGNLGDRIATGQVTDFVLLAFFPFIFNFADAAITLGGSVLAVRLAGGGGLEPSGATSARATL